MSVWVKICANTSAGDALLAAEAGADAVGFVFAPSPRRVTVEQVAAMAPRLPEELDKIGVFVDAPFEEIAAAVRRCCLSGVQLHAGIEGSTIGKLRWEFGPALKILRVVHFGPEAVAQASAFAADSQIDGVLVDSRTATAVGGTGISFDWAEAARTVFADGKLKLIAAGGLNPENVGEAIRVLRPWGVDVASGVEAAPGRKDPERVRAFIQNARRSVCDPF
ncbi:MAG: phosphoribosylanthranilate isomerase [Acidobacteriota bacterium]